MWRDGVGDQEPFALEEEHNAFHEEGYDSWKACFVSCGVSNGTLNFGENDRSV